MTYPHRVTAEARYADHMLDPHQDRRFKSGRLTFAEAKAKADARRAKQYFFVQALIREGMESDGMFQDVTHAARFETMAEAEAFARRVRDAGDINTRFWFGPVHFGYNSQAKAAANLEAARA